MYEYDEIMKWKKKIEVLTSVQQVICVLQYMYNVIHLCQGIFVNMYTFFCNGWA